MGSWSLGGWSLGGWGLGCWSLGCWSLGSWDRGLAGGYFFVASFIHVLRGYYDAGGLCLISLSDEPSVAPGYSS